ncbi:MAG: PKD domain-containing protein, partial [Solirubrobacterales bacterium]
ISYAFQSAGTQYMRLTVTDVDGDANSSVKTISVAEEAPPPPDTPPNAVWTAPEEATVGVPVTLDGTASSGDESLECTWSFENQSGAIVWETHTGCIIPFTFQIADTKYVELTVTNSSGESDTNRQSFPVTATAPEPPEEPAPPEEPTTPPPPPPPPVEPEGPAPHATVQAIWFVPAGARPGQTVRLDGTASTGDGPLSCVWTIESRSGSRVYRRSTGCTFAYRIPRGTEYVRLTVRDRYGASDSLRRVISGRTQAVTVQSALLHSRPSAAVRRGHRVG